MPRLKDFSIRQKENVVYEIRFRKYGYNVSFASKDFSVAKQKAFMWLSEFESQVRPNVHFTVLSQSESERFSVGKNTLFKTFADTYLYNVKKKAVKGITFKKLFGTYEKHIVPRYGKMPINQIKPMLIQEHLSALHAKTPRLCETVKGLLSNVFEYAVNNGITDRNPIKAVFVAKHERTTGQALTWQEEKEFIKAIENSRYKTVFLKMLYSGVRPCEVNYITENAGDKTLTIKNGKLKSYQKNYYRTIPIFPKYEPYAGTETNKVDTNKLGAEFRALCPSHQLKDLRHTFTTRARECGIDNELVAVWTGHSLGNITSSVYTHFSMEFQQEQAKKLIY